MHNYFNLHWCDWLQIDTEHTQNGSGKLGLSAREEGTNFTKRITKLLNGLSYDKICGRYNNSSPRWQPWQIPPFIFLGLSHFKNRCDITANSIHYTHGWNALVFFFFFFFQNAGSVCRSKKVWPKYWRECTDGFMMSCLFSKFNVLEWIRQWSVMS